MLFARVIKRLARRVGLDVRRYKQSDDARLATLLKHHGIDLVLDIGANVGQYGRLLRSVRYEGAIVSFEPLLAAYQHLQAAAANDPLWIVGPRVAIGDREGDVQMNVSANSVSSSLLAMTDVHYEAEPKSK